MPTRMSISLAVALARTAHVAASRQRSDRKSQVDPERYLVASAKINSSTSCNRNESFTVICCVLEQVVQGGGGGVLPVPSISPAVVGAVRQTSSVRERSVRFIVGVLLRLNVVYRGRDSNTSKWPCLWAY